MKNKKTNIITTGDFAIYNDLYYGDTIVLILNRNGTRCDYVTILGSKSWGTCDRKNLKKIRKQDFLRIKNHYKSIKTEFDYLNKAISKYETD